VSERFLITGCDGQLGKALVKKYPRATAANRSILDISDTKQTKSFNWSSYDVIINAAAYVNADHSETNKGREMAWRANAIGPRNLAETALQHNLHLIHISSEYVFDGTQKNHKEDEPFSPINVYGQTKAAADVVVSRVPKHHILRTTWVVGEGHNFVKTMARLAELRIDPKVVNDQFGRLTFTDEIVRAIDHFIKNKIPYGTYNVSNSGKIKSWAEIAADTFELAGHDRDRVTFITTDEYKEEKQPFAPRPIHSDLNLTKLQQTGFVSQDYGPLMEKYISKLKQAV
jgi:dTDP-4-dehydrorhamnose reductase